MMSPYLMEPMTAVSDARLSITEGAVARLRILLAEMADKQRLRIRIDGGGCSGFQYIFAFDDAQQDDDLVFRYDAIEVVVDTASLELIKTSIIDFTEDLMGAAFVIKNPNATTACGCGASFSVF